MAEVDLKREARRRRILENLDNRLEKITGKYKENSTEDKINDDKMYVKFKDKNNSIINKNISPTEKITVRKNQIDSLKQDDNTQLFCEQFQGSHYTLDQSNYKYSLLKEKTKHNDNLLNNESAISLNQFLCKQFEYFVSSLFFRSLSYILLAVFVNILFTSEINYNSHKGIIAPFIMMSIIHSCFGNKLKELQGNSTLVTMMILCNIKPKIVHTFQRISTLFSVTLKDFALYLTSFVFFNWIMFLYTDFNNVQFY